VESFIASSLLQGYDPPYAFLFTITVKENLFYKSNPQSMLLDGFEAFSIEEIDLRSFNISVIFVAEETL
jgi:hypothetical protein